MKALAKTNRKRRIIPLVLLVLFAIASHAIYGAQVVEAAPWDGRCHSPGRLSANGGIIVSGRSCSYFENSYLRAYGNAYVLSGGIYSSSINEFVNTLRSHNRGSNIQNQAGSAFIVHTMLGRSGNVANSNGGRSVSDQDFERLRVNLGGLSDINWSTEVCTGGLNTMAVAVSNRVDVMRNPYAVNRCEAGMVFTDRNGRQYKLLKRCANPAGTMSVLNTVNFNLTPTISGSPSQSEGGGAVSLTPAVTNPPPSTTSTPIDWRVTTFNLTPGEAIPPGGISAATADAFYGHGAATIPGGTGTRTFPSGTTSFTVPNQVLSDPPVGSRVCYALSIRPYSSTDSRARHSTPFCVIIAKKPKVQILGSDLVVGKNQVSNVVTSSTTKGLGGSNRTFGSWGEYGIIASGRVTSMASGAGYSGGAVSNIFCGVSLLTFSNVNAGQTSCTSASQMGGYANTRSLPDVGSRLNATSSLGASPTVNLATVNTGSYAATGNVSVSASGPIVRGKWVVINAPTATVTITGNINYTTDTLRTLSDIPQVVIIANQIRIAGSVTNVDAWLIASGATGNLITCSDVATASQLTASNCNQRLTVNGPVMAKHLYLYRTAGAGTGNQTGDPAEVFNLRPDAYLWATGYLSDDGRLQTVTTKELPPRF